MSRRNSESQEIASKLNSAAIHLLRGLRAVDRKSGLTPARLSALSVLVFGGPMTLGRLAQKEDVAGPTMTRIVDGLCDLGLANRTPHPDGGRLVLITATREGKAQMHGARQRRINAIVRAIEELPAVEQKRVSVAADSLLRVANEVGTP